MTITNSTIADNRSSARGSIGGISVGDLGGVILRNTIVARNRNIDGPADIGGNVDPLSSHNLIGDAATSGGLRHGVNGNLVGVDPLLGRLRDNGRVYLTPTIYKGSPAVRAAFSNWQTAMADVEICWQALQEALI